MLYSDPVTQGDDDSTVWRKLCFALQSGGGGVAPVNLTAPVISGIYYLGRTLSTTDGTWSGDPTSFSYQWYSGASPIVGATLSTYEVGDDALSGEIHCTVTASNATGSAGSDSNSLIDPIYAISGLVQRFEGRFPEDFLTTGGVPAGDFDPVEEILNGMGDASTTQAAPDEQPLFVENQINGYAAIETDGIDDGMLCPPADSDDQTLYVLARALSLGGVPRTFAYSGARSVGAFGTGSAFGYFQADGGIVTFDATQVATTWRLLGITLNGTAMTGESDGVGGSFTANALSGGAPGLTLGNGVGGDYDDCQIAVVFRWNRVLTEPEKVIVRQYISDIYAIP